MTSSDKANAISPVVSQPNWATRRRRLDSSTIGTRTHLSSHEAHLDPHPSPASDG